MRKSNKEISIIIPSRGRPQKLTEMMNSVLNFASAPKLIEFVLYIDEDDKSNYEMFDNKAIIIKGKRTYMGIMNNLCIQQASGKVIILCNDDVIVRTKKWDDIIYENIKLYADSIFLLYPNDLNKGSKLCSFPVFSKKFYLRYPGLFPENYKGTLIDLHIMDIFIQLKELGINRIKYLDNVVFEHLHYTTGKSSFDKTYSDRNRFADDDLFIAYSDLRLNLSNKIASDINTKSTSKQILKTEVEITKINNFQFIKKNTLMFWSSNAAFFYRSKLWFYMIARRTYNIFIYSFKIRSQ